MQIKYKKTNNIQDAYRVVKGRINHDALAKMNIKADITCQDERPAILAKGKGFSVSISFHTDHCHCELDLTLMLKPFRARIEESLKKEIESVV
jgi:hypothetical protein